MAMTSVCGKNYSGVEKVFFDSILKPAGSVALLTLCKLKNKILRASLEIRFHLIIQAYRPSLTRAGGIF